MLQKENPHLAGLGGDMDYSDYLIYKFIGLIAIVAIVNFVYAFVTGQTIEEARRDKPPAQNDQEVP